MTDPDPIYLAAARAWCLAKFPYDHEDPEARERHIAYDAASTADEPWLRAIVDTTRTGCTVQAEALDIRPGDTLLLRVGNDSSLAELDHIQKGMAGALPGVEILVVGGVDQFAVYRPDRLALSACSCPDLSGAPAGHVYGPRGWTRLRHQGLDAACPEHGGET